MYTLFSSFPRTLFSYTSLVQIHLVFVLIGSSLADKT